MDAVDEQVEQETVEAGDDGLDSEEFDVDRAKAKIRKANSEAKNLRERVKQLEAAESKLREIEDSEKSELQRLQEQLADAEKRAGTAQMESLRLQVAHDKGLTPSQARRLSGSTLEELEADADELLELFARPSQEDTPRVPSRPRPRLTDDTPSNEETRTPDQLASEVMRKVRGL
jgi:DNA repair exonuclease SbcCD ATPase subunit